MSILIATKHRYRSYLTWSKSTKLQHQNAWPALTLARLVVLLLLLMTLEQGAAATPNLDSINIPIINSNELPKKLAPFHNIVPDAFLDPVSIDYQ